MSEKKEDLLVEIGKRVRKIRMAAGIQQVQLAEEFQCAQSRISGIEKGNRDPGSDFYRWFATRTGCSLDYLILGNEIGNESIANQEIDDDIVSLYKKVIDAHFESELIKKYIDKKIGDSLTQSNKLSEMEEKIVKALRTTKKKYHDEIYEYILARYDKDHDK